MASAGRAWERLGRPGGAWEGLGRLGEPGEGWAGEPGKAWGGLGRLGKPGEAWEGPEEPGELSSLRVSFSTWVVFLHQRIIFEKCKIGRASCRERV